MRGLLDVLNTDEGRLGLGLLAAAGPSSQPQNLASRFSLAMNTFQGLQDREAGRAQQKQRNGLLELQMAQARQGVADQQAQRDWLTSLQPAPGTQGPQQLLYEGAKVGAVPVSSYLDSLKPREPKYTVVDGNLVRTDTPTPTVAFTAPAKPEAAPSSVREYEYAKSQGYNGTFEQWSTAQKKAGATSITNKIGTEKTLLNDIAGGLGKSITDARSGAQAALGTIGTVNRLYEALDSGKVMAGPGTTFRQYGLQVGNLLGVSGKDANEKLLNTRQAIQSLAQLELDAAQQMKGQGQITESERSIIRRAASGDIDGMTTGELRLLGGVLDRSARTKIQGYNTQVKPLMANPNAAPLAPFLAIEEPAARAPANAAQPQVLRFDANGNPVR